MDKWECKHSASLLLLLPSAEMHVPGKKHPIRAKRKLLALSIMIVYVLLIGEETIYHYRKTVCLLPPVFIWCITTDKTGVVSVYWVLSLYIRIWWRTANFSYVLIHKPLHLKNIVFLFIVTLCIAMWKELVVNVIVVSVVYPCDLPSDKLCYRSKQFFQSDANFLSLQSRPSDTRLAAHKIPTITLYK